MKNTTESTSRRRFLRRSGVMMALPLMESLLPRSMAAEAVRRPVKRIVVLSLHKYEIRQRLVMMAQSEVRCALL